MTPPKSPGQSASDRDSQMTSGKHHLAALRGSPGFAPPKAEQRLSRKRAVVLERFATGALTVSLIVAATAVSVGDRVLARGRFAEPLILQTPLPQLPPVSRR
jgi:hypothetical protein